MEMREIPLALSYQDVLLIPQISDIRSRNEVDLTTHITPDIQLKLPLIAANMDTIASVELAVELAKLGGICFMGRFDTPEIQAEKIAEVKRLGGRSIGVIGIKDDYMHRASLLLKAGSLALHLDIAHGHSTIAMKVISELKNKYPATSIIAGTVATYEGTKDLIQAGADSIKVGVGGGSICITRINTGSGVPQLTAVMEATRAAREWKNKYIIADGGAATSGDMVKGLAAGASAIEGGSWCAGTDEAPGTVIEKNGMFFKEYNGSTSEEEKERQLKKDTSHKETTYTLHIEGVEGMVPCKGPLKGVVARYAAGIRSGLSYSGARNITEFWEKARFVRITGAGMNESKPHDVILR